MSYSKEMFDQALNRILRYIAYRPRSVYETQQKMEFLGYAEDLIQDLLSYLQECDFLNDGLFARLWCESRVFSKKFGPRRLTIELRQKGIDSLLIEECVENVYSEISQIELAQSFLIQKFRKPDINKKQKYYTALFKQGYDSSVINESIRMFLLL